MTKLFALKTAALCMLLAGCGGGGDSSPRSADAGQAPPASEPAPAASLAPPAANAAPPASQPVVAPDPLYSRQWHLKNTGQKADNGASATPGEDLNVEPVWDSCGGSGACKGEGINIAIVDRGVEIGHKDLQQNISTSLAGRVYSLARPPVNGNSTPTGTDAETAHGTAVAGIAAARDNNGLGGRGVAPRASLLAYGLLQASTSSNEADAMTFQAANIAVSNNSWGPPDGTGQLVDSNSLWRDAVASGLQSGRNGLGTIYVWAAGNGYNSSSQDLSNYDGYANYRGVIAVGAVNAQGRRASYSEPGANVWVAGIGGDVCSIGLGIITTDLSSMAGLNTGSSGSEITDPDYTQCMDGTSAAVPTVSGVVALALQANPSLSWRDVRAVLAQSARQNDPANPSWKTNGAGHRINDAYGFGIVNAEAAVGAARAWSKLPAQLTYKSATQTVNLAIPDDNATGVTSAISIGNSGIRHIEWVDLTFDAPSHSYAGDLRIVLTSPSGTEQILAEPHFCDTRCAPYDGWRFGIAHYLDEPADGVWKISVQDRRAVDIGVFQSWQVTVYGH
jgi:kexin